MMVQLGFDSLDTILEFSSKFANLSVIFSHAGFPFDEDIWPILKKIHSIYVGLSNHHGGVSICWKGIGYLGADRRLYGTDDH